MGKHDDKRIIVSQFQARVGNADLDLPRFLIHIGRHGKSSGEFAQRCIQHTAMRKGGNGIALPVMHDVQRGDIGARMPDHTGAQDCCEKENSNSHRTCFSIVETSMPL